MKRRPPIYRRYCRKCCAIHESLVPCPKSLRPAKSWTFRRRYDSGITDQFKRLNPDPECAKCGLAGDSLFEVDHIFPRFKGGKHHLGNLQWLCKACHRKKTNLEMREKNRETARQRRELAGKLRF